MSKLINGMKYWGQLILIPIYGLSYLMPRNKKIWLFGSTFGKRFADNPKYFYLYLTQQHASEIRPIWISKNRDIIELLRKNNAEAYYLYSIKGIWYSLRAKVYIYDNYSKDICFLLSGGAKKFNLWHGIPLKMIQKDNEFDLIRNPRNFLEKIKGIPRRISDEKPKDYVLTTSQFLRPIFESAFQTKNVIVNGYPRNDNLIADRIYVISTDSERYLRNQILKWKEHMKVVLYMPTFRNSESVFFNVIDFVRFQEYLQKNDIMFLVKLHPKSKLYSEFKKHKNTNMQIMNPEEDVYPILNEIDLLVTDYSSIYFDLLLTGKPIVFFPYDFKEYLSNSRKMYFNYYDFTPGKIVINQNELELAILDIWEEDTFIDERNHLKKIVFDNFTGCASEELFHKILQITS